jgi:mannose-1-phosphate guanylyltransferase
MIRRAMVLAAGRGARLAPLTDTVPKPLAPVGGRPLLEHVLAFLRAGGVEEVVINLHHLGDRISEHVGDGERFGLVVRYSAEDPILDTGGGIKHAEPLLRGEPFLVVNGDSLLEISLREIVAFHEAHGGQPRAGPRDPDAARYGLIELDSADRVRRIVGQPAGVADAGLRPFMFPGLHVLEPGIFRWMAPDTPFGIMRVTYPRLLAADVPVFGWATAARWLTIDTPAALAAADSAYRARPFQFA